MKNQVSSTTSDVSIKILEMTSHIVSSYIASREENFSSEEIVGMIKTIHHALSERIQGVPCNLNITSSDHEDFIRDSIRPDYLICLEDGKKLKMLKRYLRTNYNLTPEEYRKKWGLPSDYPMVAPQYAKVRSKLAKEIGLGRSPEYRDYHAQRAKALHKETAPHITMLNGN